MRRWLRSLSLRAELAWHLRQRRIARTFRSEAAKRGVSSEWRRRAERCRKVFGGAA
jgi:hypothetical protein